MRENEDLLVQNEKKNWLKIEFQSFKSSKMVVHDCWKIDDDGIIVNKKKWLGCI